MRSRKSLVSAVLVTAVAFGAGGAAAFASTWGQATSGWQLEKQVTGGGQWGQFTAVTAVGRNGGWAFDGLSTPVAWKRSGSTWTKVPFPVSTGEQVILAAATSPANVWAFTQRTAGAQALRWNGHTWTVERTFLRQIGGAVVLGPDDVWVFGLPDIPGAYLGAWHYNGSTWTQVAGGAHLEGGSAVSANDIWAFDGSDVAHWNGRSWTRTSVASLLPPRNELNGPAVTGIYAQSADSVYATGNGNDEDDGGPLVVLHYNGVSWTRVAEGNYGFGTAPLQQITPDGQGGCWLPMPGGDESPSYLLHYSDGTLAPVTLPVAANKVDINAVALIPGTTSLLAAGDIHETNNQTAIAATLYQYRP